MVRADDGVSSSWAVPGHLQTALTSFVGRRDELVEVKQRMAESRLVTLTGPGGVGKTRLALEVAERSRRALRDGVFVVTLAGLRDESRLPQAVVSALAVPDQSSLDPATKLLEHLHPRQLLIVLDNCEHLLDACARLTKSILRNCATVRILATSREPLGLSGEAVFQTEPLSVPPSGHHHEARAIGHYEAVGLLVDRARHVLPEFEVTDDNVAAVVQLCDRLDGMPLAIELAATRLRSLSMTQIVDRLDRRFSLLSVGDRAAMPRQQSLRALMDWSYELCAGPEQLLWGRLSVFPDAFDLDAAEQVCGFGELASDSVIDLLDRLVAKSLVQTHRHGEQVRFRQLMTVREYGAELLQTQGDTQELRRRHRDHYLRAAADVAARWFGPHQVDDLTEQEQDHANFLAALEWSYATEGEHDVAAELACLLRYHWHVGGRLNEGRSWLDQLLRADRMSQRCRGQVLWVSAWIALMQDDRDAALVKIDECAKIGVSLGDPELTARAEDWRGLHDFVLGDIPSAIERYQRATTYYTRTGDTASLLNTEFKLACAQACASQLDDALATCERITNLSEQHGERWCRAYAQWITGLCRWHQGDLTGAGTSVRQGLVLARDFNDGIVKALMVELLSSVAASTADFEQAARLAGAASAIWARAGTGVTAFGLHLLHNSTRTAERIDRALGAQRAATLRSGTMAMTMDSALELALGVSSRRPPAVKALSPSLTKRETEVARLVALGKSNRTIAQTLVLSTRTVDGHVEKILSKLGCSSRTQIASWVASERRTSSA